MTNIFTRLSVAIGAIASAAPLFAAPLELNSSVFVERQQKRADGSVATVLEAPKKVLPGDQLVFVVRYRNAGQKPASDFVVTNPLPGAVAFSGTADGTEIVSVDGGKSWDKLAKLRIARADGTSRPALMTDVTHIKWVINQTLTAGAEGKLVFRGVVR